MARYVDQDGWRWIYLNDAVMTPEHQIGVPVSWSENAREVFHYGYYRAPSKEAYLGFRPGSDIVQYWQTLPDPDTPDVYICSSNDLSPDWVSYSPTTGQQFQVPNFDKARFYDPPLSLNPRHYPETGWMANANLADGFKPAYTSPPSNNYLYYSFLPYNPITWLFYDTRTELDAWMGGCMGLIHGGRTYWYIDNGQCRLFLDILTLEGDVLETFTINFHMNQGYAPSNPVQKGIGELTCEWVEPPEGDYSLMVNWGDPDVPATYPYGSAGSIWFRYEGRCAGFTVRAEPNGRDITSWLDNTNPVGFWLGAWGYKPELEPPPLRWNHRNDKTGVTAMNERLSPTGENVTSSATSNRLPIGRNIYQ